jgi:integrase
MSENRQPVRGLRNPTAAWIVSYIGKRGKSYRVRWIDPTTGKTMSEAVGRDMAVARDKRNARSKQLREGLIYRPQNKSLSELRDALPELMSGKSPLTISKTKASIQMIIDLCEDKRLANVDRSLIMTFRKKRADQKMSIATINRDLRQIRSALSYAVDKRWMPENPLLRWKGMMTKEPQREVRVVEPAEFQAILGECKNPTLRVLFIVAYATGLRRTELVNLRWTALDLDRGVLKVLNNPEAGELTKSRRNREVPLGDAVKRELSALFQATPKVLEGGQYRPKFDHCFVWPDGSRYLVDWLTREFTRIAKDAKISPATLHDLRRSFSTLAQRAGVDSVVMQRLGGWADLTTVRKHYTGDVTEADRRAIDQLTRAQGVAG